MERSSVCAGDALPPDAFADVALSRDGRWVVANSFDVAKQATVLWSYDLQRGSRARLTFQNVDDLSPVLSPDGTRIVFGSRRRGSLDLSSAHWSAVARTPSCS